MQYPEKLFAATLENISGSLSFEGLDIRIGVTNEELDELSRAQNILAAHRLGRSLADIDLEKTRKFYASFMQAHNHELAHFYQVLALPNMQLVWGTRLNWTRTEIKTMVSYFRRGYFYRVGKDRKILDIIPHQDRGKTSRSDERENKTYEYFSFYQKSYYGEYKGLSFHHLMEGMAHVISLHLDNTGLHDALGLEEHGDYTLAYRYFLSSFESQAYSKRENYLFFVFICFFVGQFYGTPQKENPFLVMEIFFFACSRMPNYVCAYEKLRERYKRYSREELIELRRWKIQVDEVKHSDRSQIIRIYSFFELLEVIKGELTSKIGIPTRPEIEALSDFVTVSEELSIFWDKPETLAKLLIFPSNYVKIREVYDAIKDTRLSNKTYQHENDVLMYDYIGGCKNLLNAAQDTYCCNDHGVRSSQEPLLYCENPDSFASITRQLFQKEPKALFRFPQFEK